jgi:hypothetical protein
VRSRIPLQDKAVARVGARRPFFFKNSPSEKMIPYELACRGRRITHLPEWLESPVRNCEVVGSIPGLRNLFAAFNSCLRGLLFLRELGIARRRLASPGLPNGPKHALVPAETHQNKF